MIRIRVHISCAYIYYANGPNRIIILFATVFSISHNIYYLFFKSKEDKKATKKEKKKSIKG